jgi:hypothetical protein
MSESEAPFRMVTVITVKFGPSFISFSPFLSLPP